MSFPVIILVTICYFSTAIDQLLKGNISVGVMFLGYTFANFGILGVLK